MKYYSSNAKMIVSGIGRLIEYDCGCIPSLGSDRMLKNKTFLQVFEMANEPFPLTGGLIKTSITGALMQANPMRA